jgi:hypothetical protein
LFRNQIVSLGIEKNGGRLFRRPKLTLSCSAKWKEGISLNGKRDVSNIASQKSGIASFRAVKNKCEETSFLTVEVLLLLSIFC